MKPWNERPHEVRHLLNPAFCSVLLWCAAKGAAEYAISPRSGLSIAESFLILPLALHKGTREVLPRTVKSSLPVWVNSEPMIIARLPERAKSLVPHTKEAIAFGGGARLLKLQDNEIIGVSNQRELIKFLRQASGEIKECLNKSMFLGKWFAHTGTTETIFTLFGVRP